MSMVNDYLMFRLLMEKDESRKAQRRQSIQPHLLQQHRGSIFVPRTSISDGKAVSVSSNGEPLSKVLLKAWKSVLLIPQRPDVGDEPLMGAMYPPPSVYGGQRRRRMSLLQTLRQQNRQLNDSGLEMNRPHTSSPPNRSSPPPPSPSKKAFASLKSKLFGRRDKRGTAESSSSFNPCDEHSQSCDFIGVVMGNSVEILVYRKLTVFNLGSCPDLSSLRISPSSRAPIVDSESEEDPVERNSSPITGLF
ncbi:hypothetical protein GCK32_017351 [Trichostrongylus colubriformis]|uniref:Uncharacterized protein n=1 Tax=Trichostrongylus colubriformis TaxID=6319 RepID=A0AAN8IGN1_TRICO